MRPSPPGGRLHHDRAYFEAMYDGDDDPWGFDRRWYEHRKYALTLAALPRRGYQRAFEPGCANGALTELLQARCASLVATDLLDGVAQRARDRLAAWSHVTVRCAPFPGWWPEGPLDLVVLSEVAYYLTEAGRRAAGAGLDQALATDGEVVAVHYTGATDYPMHGGEVAAWLDSTGFLRRLVTHDDEQFTLGVWRRSAPSR